MQIPARKKLVRLPSRLYSHHRRSPPTNRPVRDSQRRTRRIHWQPRSGTAVLSWHTRLVAPMVRPVSVATPEPSVIKTSQAGASSSTSGRYLPRASRQGRPAGAGDCSTVSGPNARRAIASRHTMRPTPRRPPLRRPLHTRLPGGSARRWGALLAGGKGVVLARRPSFLSRAGRATRSGSGNRHARSSPKPLGSSSRACRSPSC
jgi:hypothetical protein